MMATKTTMCVDIDLYCYIYYHVYLYTFKRVFQIHVLLQIEQELVPDVEESR